jgi:hypothetical protein
MLLAAKKFTLMYSSTSSEQLTLAVPFLFSDFFNDSQQRIRHGAEVGVRMSSKDECSRA